MTIALIDSAHSQRILDAIDARHGRQLEDERFSVSARLEEGSVIAELTLERHDRSFRYEMACAKSLPEDEAQSVEETLEVCLDFLDWYLGEYFSSDRELLLPLDWQPHRFGEFDVHARGDVRNPTLDAAADAWLRGERS
jgi:hypothetical protein